MSVGAMPLGISWEGVRWPARFAIGAAAAVVIIFLINVVEVVGRDIEWIQDPGQANYNLMVQGFRDGQLNLKKDVPPGLASLRNPYDPTENLRFRAPPYNLHDLSYFQGKFYMYYGPVPALVVFWPCVALTGHFLFPRHAAEIFSIAGYLSALALLLSAWRRYFPSLHPGVVAAGALALGAANGVPILLQRPGVCEVPISCAYAFIMLSLLALWRALHDPEHRDRWTVAASVAYGLAVGSRPSALFGAVVLLVPAIQASRDLEGRFQAAAAFRPLLAALVPIGLIGIGLAGYNFARFDDPLEFGESYQLSAEHFEMATGHYSPSALKVMLPPAFGFHYFLYNLRIYFLEPVMLRARFPFLKGISAPPPPVGHSVLEDPYGILPNVPFVWLALAVPLAWRGRAAGARILRLFLGGVLALFAASALVLCFYWGGCERYEAEFLPALILAAVFGLFGLEDRLARAAPGPRLGWRVAWGALLGVSVAFNLCAAYQNHAGQLMEHGMDMVALRHTREAEASFRKAIRFDPDYGPAYNNLGVLFLRTGRVPEAKECFVEALAVEPDLADTWYNLAMIEERAGDRAAARLHASRAVALDPNTSGARDMLRRLGAPAQ